MLINLFHVVLLGILFFYTLHGARRAVTRRLSLIPLSMCLIEMLLAEVLDMLAFPVLGALLAACRLTVAACCVLAVRKDAALAHARTERRVRARRAKLHALESRQLQRFAA